MIVRSRVSLFLPFSAGLAGLALTPLSLALQPQIPQLTGIPSSYPLDVDVPSAQIDVTRMAVAEVNGNTTLDVALLQGVKVTISYNPGFAEASNRVPGEFYDICAWSPTNEDKDATVVSVGVGSLQTIKWDEANDVFIVAHQFDPVTDFAAYSAWEDATMVRSGDVARDGVPDLVGVAANGNTILTAHRVGAAFQEPLNGSQIATVTGQVLDLVCFRSTAGAKDHIAVLSTTGIHILDGAGAPLRHYPATTTFGRLATVSNSPNGAEGVVWLQRVGTGGRFLHLFNPQNVTVIQTLNLSSFGAAAVTSGDYSRDGRSDLALTNDSGTTVRILTQRPSGLFSLGAQFRIDHVITNPPSATTAAPVALFDADGDADLDVAYPISDTRSIFLSKNDVVQSVQLAPILMPVGGVSGSIQVWVTEPDPADATSVRQVHARFLAPSSPPGELVPLNPAPVGTMQDYPEGATDLEVQLYTSRHLAGGDYETDALRAAGALIPFDAFRQEGVLPFLQTDLPFMEGADLLTDIQYLMTRYVRVEGGVIVQSWPHTSIYLHDPTNQTAKAYLGSVPFVGEAQPLYTRDPWNTNDPVSIPEDVYNYYDPGGTVNGTAVGGSGGTGCNPDYSSPPDESTPPDTDEEAPDEPAGG